VHRAAAACQACGLPSCARPGAWRPWEERVPALLAAAELDRQALLNHLPVILDEIDDDDAAARAGEAPTPARSEERHAHRYSSDERRSGRGPASVVARERCAMVGACD
jgi:hypothetical protein